MYDYVVTGTCARIPFVPVFPGQSVDIDSLVAGSLSIAVRDAKCPGFLQVIKYDISNKSYKHLAFMRLVTICTTV